MLLLVNDAVAVGMDLPMIQVIGETVPDASSVPTAAAPALEIDSFNSTLKDGAITKPSFFGKRNSKGGATFDGPPLLYCKLRS